MLICDNQVALDIASKLLFCQRTEHIDVNFQFIEEYILSGDITTPLDLYLMINYGCLHQISSEVIK